MKKFFILFFISFSIGLLLISFIAYANQTSISNYYPSPSGNYTKVHLINPGGTSTSTFCTAAKAGTIMADPTTGYLEICKSDGSVASFPGSCFTRFANSGPASCPTNYQAVSTTAPNFGTSGIVSWFCCYTGQGATAVAPTNSGCFSIYSNAPTQPAACNSASGNANAYDMGCDVIASTDMTSNGNVYKRNCCFNNSSGSYALGAPPSTCTCVPTTCALLGDQCGTPPNGCGATLSCGLCTQYPNSSCNSSYQCICTPNVSCPAGDNCGVIANGNGCGGSLTCGPPCTSPNTCGGGGVPYQCGCTKQCSGLCGGSDGCGGTCPNNCTLPQTCDGCGSGNTCGGPLETCASLGAQCGTPPNGCGTNLSCGPCSPSYTNTTCNSSYQCVCTPNPTSCPAGDNCGTLPGGDGCGNTITCGPPCTGTDTCGGGGVPNQCGGGCPGNECNGACCTVAQTECDGTTCCQPNGTCTTVDQCGGTVSGTDNCNNTCSTTAACSFTCTMSHSSGCPVLYNINGDNGCAANMCQWEFVEAPIIANSTNDQSWEICNLSMTPPPITLIDTQYCDLSGDNDYWEAGYECPFALNCTKTICTGYTCTGTAGSTAGYDNCGQPCTDGNPVVCTGSQICGTDGYCCTSLASCPTCIDGTVGEHVQECNLTCTANCYSSLDEYCSGTTCENLGGCFTSGTKVLLASGKKAPIESLKVGDILLGPGGVHNKVVKFDIMPKKDWTIYAFNGGRYFVTENHIFKTTSGWEALNPELAEHDHPQIKVGKLKIGDQLFTLKGLVRLEKIESKIIKNSVVYNPELDGTNEYYADDFSVHNKGTGCFASGTKILLANGKKAPIESLKIGDILLGPGNAHNKIVKFDIMPKTDWTIYAFNGGRYFVTENHVFKTTSGWEALNPEAAQRDHPQIKVGKLKIGDELITLKGLVRLEKIESKIIKNSVVYNPELDGTEEYYADGFLVHNAQKPPL